MTNSCRYIKIEMHMLFMHGIWLENGRVMGVWVEWGEVEWNETNKDGVYKTTSLSVYVCWSVLYAFGAYTHNEVICQGSNNYAGIQIKIVKWICYRWICIGVRICIRIVTSSSQSCWCQRCTFHRSTPRLNWPWCTFINPVNCCKSNM